MTGESTRVLSLFKTPVLTTVLPGANALNPPLREAILARREIDAGVSHSNLLGWQSDKSLPEWGGEPARIIRDWIVAACERVTVDLKAGGRRRFRWLPDMWANVSPPGASNQTHSHPGSYWSAVYYVDDGFEGASDPALGGELVFLDPRMPMIRMGAPDLRYRRQDGSHDHHETWIRPSSGRVVIFPSWLMHSVRPYSGKGLRISIAVNVAAAPLPQA